MIEYAKEPKSANPTWFRMINLLFLLPILFWPIVLVVTAFMFDRPGNFIFTLLLYLLINAYPVYLIFLLLFNARLFRKKRDLAILLPFIFAILVCGSLTSYMGGLKVLYGLVKQIGSKPQTTIDYENVIGFNYSKDFTNLYYCNVQVPGADLQSFELVSFHWARDKNCVYYKGKAVSGIHRDSFRRIGDSYVADKFHVYYDTSIVPGADPGSFYFMANSEDGADMYNCFRKGEPIDCIRLNKKK